MRYRVYFGSLFGYFTIHIMRMAIPFNQKQIAQYFDLSYNMVGLANSFIYIILGITYMYKVVYPVVHVKTEYFYPVSIACLFYLMIPIYCLLGIKSTILLFISMGAFGMFQATSWPIVLKLVDKYFDPKKDGFVLGIWSTNGDLGNVFGFGICTLFVYTFNWPWELCLVFAAFSSFCLAFLILKLPINEKEDKASQIGNHERGDLKVILTLFRHMKKPSVFYLVFILCLLKALLYGVLLWIPLYLDNSGFQEFTGYIPISFSIMTIIGSILFGLGYQLISRPVVRQFSLIIINIISIAAFWGIKITPLQTSNQWLLLLLVGITGFCIAGKYNVQVAHETLIMCEENQIEIVIWSSLMESMGYIFVGIFQIIIGISTSINVDSIFIVFLLTSIIGLIAEIINFIYQRSKRKETVHAEHMRILDDRSSVDTY